MTIEEAKSLGEIDPSRGKRGHYIFKVPVVLKHIPSGTKVRVTSVSDHPDHPNTAVARDRSDRIPLRDLAKI
jgi:hypothetical protein